MAKSKMSKAAAVRKHLKLKDPKKICRAAEKELGLKEGGVTVQHVYNERSAAGRKKGTKGTTTTRRKKTPKAKRKTTRKKTAARKTTRRSKTGMVSIESLQATANFINGCEDPESAKSYIEETGQLIEQAGGVAEAKALVDTVTELTDTEG